MLTALSGLSVCAVPLEHVGHFRTMTSAPLRQSYVLTGGSRGERDTAYVGANYVRMIRRTGPLVEEWDDEADASTHTFWNGFTGVAAAWRQELRHDAQRVLTGRLASLPIRRITCRRRHTREYLVLTFAPRNQVQLQVALDPQTDLPASVQASSGHQHVSLDDIRFRAVDNDQVPVGWREAERVVAFSAVALDDFQHGDAHGMASAVAHRGIVQLRRNWVKPYSAGVPAVVNGTRAKLLVDTGAAVTIVSHLLAVRSGIRPLRTTYARIPSGYARVTVGIARSIVLGPLRLRNEPVLVFPTAFGYDGAIGSALFGRADVTFRERFVTIDPSRPQHRGASVPIDTYDGIPVVHAWIGSQETPLALDTGAAFYGLFPGRFASEGRKLKSDPRACIIHDLPAIVAPRLFHFGAITVAARSFPANVCVGRLDEAAAPNVDLPLLGFRTLAGRLHAVHYRTGTVLFR